MSKKFRFAVVAGRYFNAVVGARVHRDDVPTNLKGYEPRRFKTRKEADAEAFKRADFGGPVSYDVMVVRKSGRRGWVVVAVLEGQAWG